MENLLLDMYNQNLANQATNLYNQRQRDLVNQAAMDVFSTGFQNRGILNTQPAMAFNDYYGPSNIDTSFGVANEPDVEEEQSFLDMITGGLQNISNKSGITSLLGYVSPLAGLVSKGISSLGGSFVGPKGSRGYGSDTTLGLFGRSNTLADFAQALRDQKARDDAAKRGAFKQKAKDLDYEFDAYGGTTDSSGHAGGQAAADAAASQAADDEAAGAGGY